MDDNIDFQVEICMARRIVISPHRKPALCTLLFFHQHFYPYLTYSPFFTPRYQANIQPGTQQPCEIIHAGASQKIASALACVSLTACPAAAPFA